MMKEDMNRYLEGAGLDGLLVLGPTSHNPAMSYFTGPVHVGWGALALRRGAPGVLYAGDMEREEAALTGYEFIPLDWPAYLRQAGDDPREATAIALEAVLQRTELTGRIQVVGLVDAGDTLATFRRLERRLPGLTVVEFDRAASPIHRMRATKDASEVERIRRMGQVTVEVVGRVADFLATQSARQGFLTDRRGKPVTVGDVKQRIDLWLMQLGAENPEGTIFAIGRDAGVPHNAGVAAMPIPVGQPIIFDIFPCEIGGGYFYDFTRTWCVGHAPEDVAAAHAEVVAAYDRALPLTRSGAMARDVQRAVCEFFEGRGHRTVMTDPQTREGYVHSIGHGLGLEVHEYPNFSLQHEPPDVLEAGHVVTIEPGLYYPERGFGVRVEDTLWIGPDGPQVLAPFPMDLILPLRRSRRAPAKSAPSKSTTKSTGRTKKAQPRPARRSRRGG
jgi:Xaa-Pro aminopeptidase